MTDITSTSAAQQSADNSGGTLPRNRAPVRLTYTHDAMIDVILADPTVTSQELAEVFGYTQAWVSRIISSDSFSARLAQRKGAFTDPIIAQNLNARLKGVATRSLEAINERLESSNVSAAFALKALELAQQGLGITA